MIFDLKAEPLDLAFNPRQSQTLAVSTIDGKLIVLDTAAYNTTGGNSVESISINESSGYQIFPDTEVARCLSWHQPLEEQPSNLILCASKHSAQIKLWDCQSEKEVCSTSNSANGHHEHPISRIISLYENLFATGDEEGYVKVWDSRSMDLIREYHDNEDYISDFAYDAGRKTLLACGGDGYLSVFDIRKRELLARSDQMESEILSVQIIKNGKKVVVGMEDGALGIFNWDFWGDIKDRIVGHPLAVDSMVKYSEDTVLTGSSDGFIRVVDIYPTEFAGIIGDQGCDYPIERMSLSCCSRYLATCSHDSLVRVWDLESAGNSSDTVGNEEQNVGNDCGVSESDNTEMEGCISEGLSDDGSSSSEMPARKRPRSTIANVKPINEAEAKGSFFAGLEADNSESE